MKHSFALVALLSVGAWPAAAEAPKESPEFTACMEAVDLGAFKNSQWAACYEAELQRQDAALNAVYKRVAAAADPDARKLLVAGERAWIAYRDAWCAYEEVVPMAPGGEVNLLACRLDLTQTQVGKLSDLAEAAE